MDKHRHVRLFRNGRNQAVRIPVEFELPGDEAIVYRDGERLVIEPVRNVCTSIIVAAELRYGCAKRGSKRLLKAVEDILSEMAVLPFDVPADAEYSGIRSALEAAGRLIGSNDLLIAAHACASGATLVTANTDEFNRVRGLRIENWLA